MNISFKTNVKTVIRYKGQEYSSVAELPPEVRSKYEETIAKGLAAIPGAKQQIVVNGEHFASVDEMPVTDKKLYEDAMALVHDRVSLPNVPAATLPASNGWLTPTQFRLVLLFGAIVGLAVAIRLLL